MAQDCSLAESETLSLGESGVFCCLTSNSKTNRRKSTKGQKWVKSWVKRWEGATLVIMCKQERIQLDNEILIWVCMTHSYKINLFLLHPNCSDVTWNRQGGKHWLFTTSFIASFGDISSLMCIHTKIKSNFCPGNLRDILRRRSNAFTVWLWQLSACSYKMWWYTKRSGNYSYILSAQCSSSLCFTIYLFE